MGRSLSIIAMALLAWTPSLVLAQQRTITFSNMAPPVVLRLDPTEPVTFLDNGSYRMVCLAGSPEGCGRLTQGGGGPPPPNNQCGTGVSFTSQLNVTFPLSPPAPGPYAPGAQLSLGATTSGGILCLPSATRNGSAVSITGWTAPLTPSLAGNVTGSITLPNQSQATFVLRLTCFGNNGSAWTDRTVQTQ